MELGRKPTKEWNDNRVLSFAMQLKSRVYEYMSLNYLPHTCGDTEEDNQTARTKKLRAEFLQDCIDVIDEVLYGEKGKE